MLERQRQHEQSVRAGPGRYQEWHEPEAVGELDVNVSEIRFEALAWQMPQRYEGLLVARAALSHIALDLGIAAAVAMLVVESPEDLGSSVSLLARCGFIIAEDLVNDLVKQPQLR